MRQPTDAEIETAVEWLHAFDGASEPDNGKDIETVIAWLDDLLAQRMIRAEAKRAGVPTAKLRKRIADRELEVVLRERNAVIGRLMR